MWPFRKKQSEPQGYEAQMVDALEAQASGAATRKQITGYIQAAKSAWCEAGALANVEASETVKAALSPDVLGNILADQIMNGGSFHRLVVVAGNLHLQRPLSTYRLAKGGGWQIQIGEPSNPSMLNVLDSEVLYIPWQTEPASPYVPVAPWRNATGMLATEEEDLLISEMRGPMGSVLFLANPTPYPDLEAVKKSGKAYINQFDGLSGKRRGQLAILSNPNQSGNKGFTQDSQGKPFRIGASPPQALAELRAQLGGEILAACSIPPAMLLGGSPGPATITARRNFERTIVPARFKIVSAYLSAAFAEPVMLTYPVKHRADNSTAARTVAALQKAGMKLDDALELAGLK